MRRKNHNEILKKSLSLAIVFAILLPISNGASLLQLLEKKSKSYLLQNNAIASTYPADLTSEKVTQKIATSNLSTATNSLSKTSQNTKNPFMDLKIFDTLVAEAANNNASVSEPATQNVIKNNNEIILIIADKDLVDNDNLYPGLSTDRDDIDAVSFSSRIRRYAKDIVNEQPMTDVQIVVFDKNIDTAPDLSLMLDKYYKNNNHKLSGIILIGNVPLPVVNKNGNQFVSMLPYTDFEDKTYIYNKKTQTFNFNTTISTPKAEIWHGVMRPSSDTPYSLNEFAAYLDKNHLYHTGDPEYANFEKRIFFGDFVNEEKNLNKNLYSRYMSYIDTLEDVAYFRYNKFWANELQGDNSIPTSQDVENGIELSDDTAKKREEFKNSLDNMPQASIPDIFTKQIIDKQLAPYYKLATKYVGIASGLAEKTGRYSKNDILTAVSVISMKDEYAKTYLKNVNDMLETEINKMANITQTPLPLIDSATAYIKDGDTESEFKTHFRFNYKNEATDENYLNGILTKNIQSPKQCSLFLGSTKEDYFNESGGFNPKAISGEYSILTRDIRPDNPRSAAPLNTVGVHTRLLSPKEAFSATNGDVSYGAVIETDFEYGIPAFLHNPNYPYDLKYLNPLSQVLSEGDVITKLNRQPITPMHSFDIAITEMHQQVMDFISAINNGNLDKILKDKADGKYTYFKKSDEAWSEENVKAVTSDFEIEYYHDGQKKNAVFTFTVHTNGKSSNSDPRGTPEMLMSFSNKSFPSHPNKLPDSVWSAKSQGALFTLNNNDFGFGAIGDGYSIDAGCNANNISYMGGANEDIPLKNLDRCFYQVSMMPILDTTGGINISKTDDGFYYDNNANQNTNNLFTELLQLPVNGDDSLYKLDDIDEIYLDSCFAGLPASDSLSSDENEFYYPPDPLSNILADSQGHVTNMNFSMFHNIDDENKKRLRNDVYARLLSRMGNFIVPGAGDDNGNVSKVPASNFVWSEFKDLDATKIILYDAENSDGDIVHVTLDDFSSVYGIFDGKDNDGDGIFDYEMRDLKDENGDDGQDGIKETKWYGDGFPEASAEYGLPANNLPAIYRRMFSKNNVYILPKHLSPTGTELKLIIDVNKNKDLNSVILHNEPTSHTLLTQMESMTTSALPIDNPRYVTFLTEKDTLKRINYPNTFKTSSFAQLKADLDQIATEFSLLDNGYKLVNDATYGQYSPEELKNKILEERLLPLVNNENDNPPNGFNLDKASTEKIYDAIKWINLDVDQKHEYALEYYLNPDKDAFIKDTKKGFELGYLVFNGDDSEISFGFNKIEESDNNPLFAPLAIATSNTNVKDENNDESVNNEKNDDGDWYEDYISLKEFFKELKRFSNEFQDLANGDSFENACMFTEDEEDKKEDIPQKSANSDVASFKIEPESNILIANGESKTRLKIVLYDKDGDIAGGAFENISLFTNELTYFDSFADLDPSLTGTQIAINEGVGYVDLFSTSEIGESLVSGVLMTQELEDLVIVNDGSFKDVDFSQYLTDSKQIELIESAELNFEQTNNILAGSNEQTDINITLTDNNDNILTGYNGPINIIIINDKLGSFETIPDTMTNGKLTNGALKFTPKKKAGLVSVSVEIPKFISKTFNIEIKPNTPNKIVLSTGDKSIFLNRPSILTAKILDEFGNVETDDSSSIIKFNVTEYSRPFAHFGSTNRARVDAGVAQIILTGGKVTGIANITASLVDDNENDNIEDTIKVGTLSLRVKSNIDINMAKEISPKTLYLTLLGAGFGGLNNDENIAQALLYSGHTQAISTLTTVSNSFKAIKIDTNSNLEILDDNLSSKVLLATDDFPYQSIVISDDIKQDLIGDIFVVPDVNSKIAVINNNDITLTLEKPNLETGIYIMPLSTKANAIISNTKVEVSYDNNNFASIDSAGRLSVNENMKNVKFILADNEFKKSFSLETGLSIIATYKGEAIFAMTYHQADSNHNVIIFDDNTETPATELTSGVYFKPNYSNQIYSTETFISGNSTASGRGLYVINIDTPITDNQKVGLGYSTLENTNDTFGIGFKGDNKSILLFSAGNTVGESNKPYSSEIGIVYGDPTVHVKKTLPTSPLPFDSTLGKPLYTGKEKIKQMITADMNNDGHDDIILVYESGNVRILQNDISNKRYHDLGVVIQSSSEILSATTLDINNDGWNDLLIGTKESCHVGDDCLNLYTNINGEFKHKSLKNMINGKAYEMKGADVNADGCDDIVISDSSGTIQVFYNKIEDNKCVGLNNNSGYKKNFGPVMTVNVNQKNNLFVYYDGISQPKLEKDASGIIQKSIEDYLAEHSFIDFGYKGGTKYDSSNPETRVENKKLYFQSILFNSSLKDNSKKIAVDLNGDSLAVDDVIKYTITLQNDSNSTLKGFKLSDLYPATFSLNRDSLKCLDSACEDDLIFEETGITTRDFVISGITVPANGKRTISYTMTVNAMPKIGFEVGNNFTKYKKQNGDIVPPDDYLDIMIRKEINPNKTLTYIYSTGLKSNGEVNFDIMVYQNQENNEEENTILNEDLFDIVSCDSTEDPSCAPSVPDSVIEDVKEQLIGMSADTDFDGIPDSLGDLASKANSAFEDFNNDINRQFNDVASKIEGKITDAISATQCGSGCSPIPYNYAFLVPGYDNGVPVGFPAIAVGPSLPWFTAFAPQNSWLSTFRMYISPTASLGLGGAICIGDPVSGTAPCFAFQIPVSALDDLCQAAIGKIKGAINDAADSMSDSVKNAVLGSDSGNTDPDVGMTTMVSDGEAASTGDFSTGNFSSGGGDSPIAFSGSVNVRIPGFPGVITDWIDKQTDEVYNKLLDMPDLYIYYPDYKSLLPDFNKVGDNFRNVRNIHDVLSAINSIPLVEIETKSVELKIPIISMAEATKWKQQAKIWIAYEKGEIERVKNEWTCNENAENKTICDSIIVDMNALITSVENFMKMIDSLTELPNLILDFRTAEAKYANQIICYLDTIMEYSGGYITRQKSVLESWIKAVEKAIKAFRDWQIIFNLSVEYKESCDECKNDRFSTLGLLMNLFVVIPSPPIIEIPKWPDLVLDLSHVQGGLKIIWPDVKFTPKNIMLPDLPTVRLPNLIPNDITFNVPSIDFDKFNLDFDFKGLQLPNLPNLKLPKLPDLPRPPKIYSLPKPVITLAANLKPLFKILCLVKKGFIPIPEGSLKTEIETLTQPSVQSVFELLPLAGELGITMPGIEYDFVEKIQIDVAVNASMSTDYIYYGVKKFADKLNIKVDKYVDIINSVTTLPLQGLIDDKINDIEDTTNGYINDGIDYVNDKVDEAKDDISDYTNIGEHIDDAVDSINGAVEDVNDAANDAADSFNDNVDDLNHDINDLFSNKNSNQIQNDYNKLISGLTNFSNEIERYAKIAKVENAKIPKEYVLVASETETLDPHIERSLSQIKSDIARRGNKYTDIIAKNSQLNNILNLRNSFIAYSTDFEKNQNIWNNSDRNESLKSMIAETDSHKEVRQMASRLSKQDVVHSSDTGANKVHMNLLGQTFERETRTLIATNAENNNLSQTETKEKVINSQPSLPKGFYLTMNDITGNILSYTDEIKRGLITEYTDYDSDNDMDIVFTLGGDVYIKENHDNDPEVESGHVLDVIESISNEILDISGSINGLKPETIYNEKFDISWIDNNDYTFYTIRLMQNNNEKYKYLAIKRPSNEAFAKEVIAQLGEFDEIFEINNDNDVSVTANVENGAYTAIINGYNSKMLSSLSGTTLVTASSCADKDAPYPSIKEDVFELPIFDTLVLDASDSFDLSGHIVKYWIESKSYTSDKPYTRIPTQIWSDLNILADDDEDGVNDNDRTNPIFKIGPFTKEGDLGVHEYTLHVVDQSGNSSNKVFKIKVVNPKISLSFQELTSKDSVERSVIGEILPQYKAFFKLLRKRSYYQSINNKLVTFRKNEEISTPSQFNGLYRADKFGKYKISDLNFDDFIQILDPDDNIIAEVNPKTGNIGNVADGYHLIVNAAKLPNSPLNIQVLDSDNMLIATLFAVGDVNLDVQAFKNVRLEDSHYTSVTVNSLNDQFEFQLIPSDSVTYTGGAILRHLTENKNVAYIDTYGNLISLDNRLSLELKKNDYLKDQLIISILFGTDIIGELLIPTQTNVKIAGINSAPVGLPTAPPTRELYSDGVFVDANGELNDLLYDLYKNGIITGERGDNGLEIRPYEQITRAEFVVMLLKLLCITPRPEAYQAYTESERNGGFSDLIFNDSMPESYAYIKEADLLGLVNGYLGETDEKGLHPFKPNDTITRAESTKIILNALEFRGVLNLESLKENEIWYAPYITAGLELTPYIITDEYSASSFVITQGEASVPEEVMTRIQLFTMASRVLEFYNCFATDLDNDGMSDFCEKRYNIDNPDADEDDDGLKNIYECAYGLDPTNPDTDGCGVSDGDEVKNFMDPLVCSDDANFDYGNNDNNTGNPDSGSYVVPANCTTCPCPSTISHSADVINDDILFTAITNTANTFVFTKSNEVTVQLKDE